MILHAAAQGLLKGKKKLVINTVTSKNTLVLCAMPLCHFKDGDTTDKISQKNKATVRCDEFVTCPLHTEGEK